MIFYKVKNKKTGQVTVLTETAKNLIERHPANADKYEVLEECDQNGRSFDYNNFLNQANESKSIGIESIKKEAVEENGRSNGNAIGGIGPITETTANNGNENDKTVNSDTKPKRIKLGKGK